MHANTVFELAYQEEGEQAQNIRFFTTLESAKTHARSLVLEDCTWQYVDVSGDEFAARHELKLSEDQSLFIMEWKVYP